jgi:hypothetical protein
MKKRIYAEIRGVWQVHNEIGETEIRFSKNLIRFNYRENTVRLIRF